MENLHKTIGLKLKVKTYVADRVEEREKVIFSIRQLYRLLSQIRANGIIYGLGIEDNTLILHLFVDRMALYGHDDVNNNQIRG